MLPGDFKPIDDPWRRGGPDVVEVEQMMISMFPGCRDGMDLTAVHLNPKDYDRMTRFLTCVPTFLGAPVKRGVGLDTVAFEYAPPKSTIEALKVEIKMLNEKLERAKEILR